jgi:chromosome segregation ATPase
VCPQILEMDGEKAALEERVRQLTLGEARDRAEIGELATARDEAEERASALALDKADLLRRVEDMHAEGDRLKQQVGLSSHGRSGPSSPSSFSPF